MVCGTMWFWIWEGIQHSTLPRCCVACSDVALVHSDWRLGNHVVLGGLQSSLLVWTMPLWSPERHAISELIKHHSQDRMMGHTHKTNSSCSHFYPQDGFELVSQKRWSNFAWLIPWKIRSHDSLERLIGRYLPTQTTWASLRLGRSVGDWWNIIQHHSTTVYVYDIFTHAYIGL